MENIEKNGKGDIEQHSAMQTEIPQSLQIATMEFDLESEGQFQRGSSWRRRRSISLSRGVSLRLVEEITSDQKVAEAGDDGGRLLHREDSGQKWQERNNTGMGVEAPDDVLILSYAFRSRHETAPVSPVSPLPSDIVSPLSDHPLIRGKSHADANNNNRRERQLQRQLAEDSQTNLAYTLQYISILTHLAMFGIIGILIRYSLEVLFGPNLAKVTNDHTPLYIDLPSNMVGSFFMGWVGVIFKSHISFFSDFLAIGLTTGLMGSITTFSGWIQKVVDLTTKGHWVSGFIGLLIGMELAQMSLSIGIESANLLSWIINYIWNWSWRKFPCVKYTLSPDNFQRRIFISIISLIIGGILWVVSLALTILDYESHHRTKLWLACVIGPGGVWARWFLARLNGKGIGTRQYLKWLPIGTLLTNLIATSLMATFSTMNLVIKTKNVEMLCGGIELGFLGCMSTVSTFVAEVHAMHQSNHPWRAYVYILFTLILAFTLGTLIYSIPVWARGYLQP